MYGTHMNIARNVTESERDTDLALLACDAATELDELVLGRSDTLNAVHLLAAKISKVFLSSKGAAAQVAWVEPAAIVVMKQAIDDAIMPKKPITTVPELAQEAEKIEKRLSSLGNDQSGLKLQNTQDLEEMRSFCLALSKHASAQGRPLYDRRPDRPFRR